MMMGASGGIGAVPKGIYAGGPRGKKEGCQRTGPRCAAPQCPPSTPPNGLCLLPPPPPGPGRGLSPLRRWWSRCERIGVQSGCGPPWPRAPGGARPPPSPAMPAGSTEPDGILSYQVGGAWGGGYPVRPEDALWLLTAAFPAAGGGSGEGYGMGACRASARLGAEYLQRGGVWLVCSGGATRLQGMGRESVK